MLDYIKATQQATSKSNEFNLELNSKFGILYKNQMLNELENQSKQIEDLLKTKERHQKIIWVLQQEIKTHKKIEEMIIKKNNTYLNIAKKTKNMNESNEFLSSKKIPLLNFMKGNDCLTERNSNSRSIFHSLNKKEYHDYKSLEKIYKELLDEYREIKNKYNTLKDKEKNNNIKYKGIINLFNDALDGLMQDEEIKSKKNIYININEINKGNFESLTKEEKYFILVKLLNNLLSLITINEKEEKLISLKDNIKNVEFKLKKPKIIHRNKYFETPKLQKPFLGMTSSNFYNISTNYESNTNSNERQHFVSIFGDDFIQFGKNIFPEANSVKKERDSYKNNYEKINKKKSLGDKNKKKLYEKANKYIIRKSREKEENNLLTEGNRKSRNDNQNINYQIKRGNTYDKQFIRELVI
jgi:hypothetical protein